MSRMRYVVVMLILIAVTLMPITAHAQLVVVKPPINGACWGLWNVTILPGQYLVIHVLSNNYSLYVFTPTQYSDWVSGGGAFAVYAQYVVDGEAYVVPLPPGQYSVVLYPTPCGVGVNAVIRVVDWPGVGITALGPITTNELLAYVNLTEYQPDTPISIAVGSLVVGGGYYGSAEYWVEGVLSIEGGNALLLTRVINVTGQRPQVVSARSLTLGRVKAPCAMYLAIMTNATGGIAEAWVGYAVLENGTQLGEPVINWVYTEALGPATKAVIMMNPYLATPSGYSYDSELIISNGLGNEQPLSAEVALLYWDGESFMPVVNTYNFALNTNLTSTYLSTTTCNGLPCVVTGEPNYGRVGIANASSVPMTYVEWEVPNGSLVSRYIVSPVNITYPHVLSSAPGTVMRLVGITVISDGGGEFLNTTSVVISPSGRPQVIVVKPNYSAYYLVSVRSLGWVTINGTRTNNYTNWLINGSVLIIRAEPNYLGNGTRLVPINGSEVSIIIERPMNLTIDWVRQYLVSIASNYPVMVNGSLTTNYVGWINECDYLVVNASIYYESGGVRYVPINGTGAFRICTPMNITVGWETQYLITVVSPIPIEVNGAMASDYVGWFANGSRISILVPKYYYPGNGTRFVLWSPVNGTVTVRGPMLIKITYSPQYLVIITSPLPIIINGTRAMNYTAWAYPSTIIKLSIPKYQVLPNLTLMIATSIYVNNHEYPLRGSVLLIINSPTSVVVEYGRSYMTYLALALITLLALVIIMKFRGSANDHHGDEAVTL